MRSALLAALLLTLSASPTLSSTEEWRPTHEDGLASLDAELAPILLDLEPQVTILFDNLTKTTAPIYNQSPESLLIDIKSRETAALEYKKSIDELQDLAKSAIIVLRDHQPETCWYEYHASQTTGWLLIGDATQSAGIGDFNSAGTQLGSGMYILLDYGTLLHQAAINDCA